MGGSTYVFDVWSGHPHEAEVLGLLGALRQRTSNLRKLVSEHNATHARPSSVTRVRNGLPGMPPMNVVSSETRLEDVGRIRLGGNRECPLFTS